MMRKFRLSRLEQVLRDPTRTAEVLIGLSFVLLPGLLMAMTAAQIDSIAGLYLAHFGLTTERLELTLILAGTAQVGFAGTDWFEFRGWLAFGVAALAFAMITAYLAAGASERLAVVLLPGILLSEGFIVWRCWHSANGQSP